MIAALKDGICNVLLLDLSLPDMSGLDVLKHVRTHHDGVAVLVLSGYPEKQFGINVLRGGAHGFLSKSADESELLRALRMVARGSRYVGPDSPICCLRAWTARANSRATASSRSVNSRFS